MSCCGQGVLVRSGANQAAQLNLVARKPARPYKEHVDTLLDAGSLADFLIARWRSFAAELDEAKRQLSDASLPGQVQEMRARYLLTVPALVSGFRPSRTAQAVNPTHRSCWSWPTLLTKATS